MYKAQKLIGFYLCQIKKMTLKSMVPTFFSFILLKQNIENLEQRKLYSVSYEKPYNHTKWAINGKIL